MYTPSKYVSLFIAAAFMTLLVVSLSHETYNICDIACYKQVYHHHCGGVDCVYGAVNETQYEKMCSDGCIEALANDSTIACLEDFDQERDDFDQVVITQIKAIISNNFKLIKLIKFKCGILDACGKYFHMSEANASAINPAEEEIESSLY